MRRFGQRGVRTAGVADHQPALQDQPPRRIDDRARQPVEDQAGGLLADRPDRLRHRGQLRPEHVGPGKIVETGDRDVFRAGEPDVADRLHHPDHHQIVGRKQRRGPVGQRQQLQRGIVGVGFAEIAEPNQLVASGQTDGGERIVIAGQPVAPGRGVEQPEM